MSESKKEMSKQWVVGVCGPTSAIADETWNARYVQAIAHAVKEQSSTGAAVVVQTGCGTGVDQRAIRWWLAEGATSGVVALRVLCADNDWVTGKHHNLFKLLCTSADSDGKETTWLDLDAFREIVGDAKQLSPQHFHALFEGVNKQSLVMLMSGGENIIDGLSQVVRVLSGAKDAGKSFEVLHVPGDYTSRDLALSESSNQVIGFNLKGVTTNGTAGNIAYRYLRDAGVAADAASTIVTKHVKDREAAKHTPLAVRICASYPSFDTACAKGLQALLEERACL